MTIHDVIGILDEMREERERSLLKEYNGILFGKIRILEEARDRIQAFYDDEAVTPEIKE